MRTEETLIQVTLQRLARHSKTTISFVFLRISQKALQLLNLFLTSRQLATMQIRLILLEMTSTRVTICRIDPTLLIFPDHFIHYIRQAKLRFELQKLLFYLTHTFVERQGVFRTLWCIIYRYCFRILLPCHISFCNVTHVVKFAKKEMIYSTTKNWCSYKKQIVCYSFTAKRFAYSTEATQ